MKKYNLMKYLQRKLKDEKDRWEMNLMDKESSKPAKNLKMKQSIQIIL